MKNINQNYKPTINPVFFCCRTLIQPIFRWGDHGMTSSRKRSSWSTQQTSPGRAVRPQISPVAFGILGYQGDMQLKMILWLVQEWDRIPINCEHEALLPGVNVSFLDKANTWIWMEKWGPTMTFWDTQTRLGKMMSARYLTFPTSLWAKHGTWLLCCSNLLL